MSKPANLLTISMVLVLGGCATIVGGGSKQAVSFRSTPNGATFTIQSSSGLQMGEGTTPGTLILPRKNEYQIEISLNGYHTQTTVLTKSINGWVWGNILFWPGFIVDFATGSGHKLEPDTVQVTMVEDRAALLPVAVDPVAVDAVAVDPVVVDTVPVDPVAVDPEQVEPPRPGIFYQDRMICSFEGVSPGPIVVPGDASFLVKFTEGPSAVTPETLALALPFPQLPTVLVRTDFELSQISGTDSYRIDPNEGLRPGASYEFFADDEDVVGLKPLNCGFTVAEPGGQGQVTQQSASPEDAHLKVIFGDGSSQEFRDFR